MGAGSGSRCLLLLRLGGRADDLHGDALTQGVDTLQHDALARCYALGDRDALALGGAERDAADGGGAVVLDGVDERPERGALDGR